MRKTIFTLLFLLLSTITFAQIQMNEFMADSGECCVDEFGEEEDFVEIINVGNFPIDISGYFFGDGNDGSFIPSGSPELTTVDAGGVLVVWFDRDVEQGPLHIDAKLNNSGESILVLNADGDTIINIDFSQQDECVSYGAIPDGELFPSSWNYSLCPSPGSLNNDCPLLEGCTSQNASNYNPDATIEDGTCDFSSIQGVYISEYSASNCNNNGANCGNYEDWVEIYNGTNESIDLSGYFLSDKIDNLTKWQFPGSLVVPSMSQVIVYASGLDPNFGVSTTNTSFKLTQTNNDEYVILSDPDGQVLDYINLENHQLNHSFGRQSNSGNWSVYVDPTPGTSNDNSDSYTAYANTPTFSLSAGFYSGAISLSLSTIEPNTSIYYTLDGSFPSPTSLFYGQTDNNGQMSPFVPEININNTTVVRAISVSQDPNILSSFAETNTYFINEQHSVAVISIAGEQVDDLLNGNQIRPIGSFEFYDVEGELVDEAVGEFNEHGNDSWAYSQRGFDYITRDQYGYNYAINDKLFRTKSRDSFQRLILKAAANDNYPFTGGSPAHIRDSYVQSLSQIGDLRMDERSHESCVLYVNGEYWGVYDVREKVDDLDFLDYYYDQGEGYVDFLKTWGNTWIEFGDDPGTQNEWNNLRDYIVNNDMSDPTNYDYVKGLYNTGSLIDYFILNSYVVCMDWLNWNTGWWRGKNPEGDKKKWRYILWDMDASFGHYINYTDIPDTGASADPCDPEGLGDPGGQGHVPILNSLLDNDEFTADYINRYADLSNTIFSCDFMINHLDSLVNIIEPEMNRQIQRWGGSFSQWQENVQELKDFILERCSDEFVEGMEECYDVEAIDITIIIDGTGEVDVNSIEIDDLISPWTGTYYSDLPISLSASGSNDDLYNFYWEVIEGDLVIPDPTNPDLDFIFSSPVTIVAHFDSCISLQTEDIAGPTLVDAGSIWQYTFPSDFTNTSQWEVEGGNILFTSSTENTIAIQWNYGTGNGQIVLSQYNQDGLLECLYLNIEIIDPQSNIADSFETAFFLAYPNPSRDYLNIALGVNDPLLINFYDISGQLIWSTKPSCFECVGVVEKIDLSFLSSGLYFVSMVTPTQSYYQQIAISK